MEKKLLNIRNIEKATHDVLRFELSRPQGIEFKPGQAADISIDKDGWEDKTRPFTFTSLPEDDHLEFTIKTYPSHNGVTNELLNLTTGDELIIQGVFGAIEYKGKGTFIAGGAGVTPFISILRYLNSENKIKGNRLIFANKTSDDIINKDEFRSMLGNDFINILSDEKTDEYAYGYISKDFLLENKSNSGNYIYLCGPPPMMEAVEKILTEINVDEKMIVKEEF